MTQVLEILHSNDITNIVHSGSDLVIQCLSPDHDDHNPSMRINNVTGAFQCMSCGFKGNIFKHFGVGIDFLDLRRSKIKATILTKTQELVGLTTPSNSIPFDRPWRNIKPETYKYFDAFITPEFEGRVVFPISDFTGTTRVFHGRLLDQFATGPKYLNYPSKVPLPLFPLVQPVNNSVILVEGFFDMLNLFDKGITNAICIFGANTFNKARLDALKVLGVKTIFLGLDNDEAGQKASEKIKKLCEESYVQAKTIKFPSSVNDAGELTQEQVDKLRTNLYGK